MADSDSKTPFTEAGECLDEVTFVFDDGQKLYVSQNFLHYVSPVFKAMFENDFKEKETRIVKLKGKRYEDFLEFLLCLHPDEQRHVDDKNVFQIVNLAEEYQAKLITKKCKNAMSEILQSELKSAKEFTTVIQRLQRARTCLKILTTAEYFKHDKTVTEACNVIGHFGYAIFTGALPESKVYSRRRVVVGNSSTYVYTPEKEDPLADCKKLFDDLPEALKNKLLLERLRLKDDLEMYNS